MYWMPLPLPLLHKCTSSPASQIYTAAISGVYCVLVKLVCQIILQLGMWFRSTNHVVHLYMPTLPRQILLSCAGSANVDSIRSPYQGGGLALEVVHYTAVHVWTVGIVLSGEVSSL